MRRAACAPTNSSPNFYRRVSVQLLSDPHDMAAAMLAPALAAALLGGSWKALPPAGTSLPSTSPPRSGATAAADKDGRVWLFGGYAEPDGKPRAVVNDLLRFDASSGDWQQLQEPLVGSDRSDRPGPRLASASAIIEDEMLLFGGWDPEVAGTGGSILDDVWSLELSEQRWTRCAQPMPRGPTSRHVACNVGGTVVVREQPMIEPQATPSAGREGRCLR